MPRERLTEVAAREIREIEDILLAHRPIEPRSLLPFRANGVAEIRVLRRGEKRVTGGEVHERERQRRNHENDERPLTCAAQDEAHRHCVAVPSPILSLSMRSVTGMNHSSTLAHHA